MRSEFLAFLSRWSLTAKIASPVFHTFGIPRAWGVLRGDRRQTTRSISVSAGVLKIAPANLPPVSSDRDGGSFPIPALQKAREDVMEKIEQTKPHSRARHWAEMELSRLTLDLLRAENDAARG